MDFLGALGGRVAKHAVFKAMTAVIGKDLALQMNWIGRDKKSIQMVPEILTLVIRMFLLKLSSTN